MLVFSHKTNTFVENFLQDTVFKSAVCIFAATIDCMQSNLLFLCNFNRCLIGGICLENRPGRVCV